MRELEKLAAERAREAVKYDRLGMRGEAVLNYKEAIQLLLKLVRFTDDPVMRRVYEEKARQYKERLEALLEKSLESAYIPARNVKEKGSYLIVDPPPVKWDDVIGLEEAKKALRESIIYPSLRPEFFPLGWPRGILFFGPPGCGKTMLAAAAANEVDALFMQADASVIMSKWLGESEKNIAALFEEARRYEREGKPVIILIDEVDSLTTFRENEVGGEARARNQLLKEMDGLQDKGRTPRIYVIAATNKPWLLDEPFIRRFQKRIYIPLPDYDARLNMFKHYTKRLDLDDDVDFNELAKLTEGYSGADISQICMEAQLKVVSEFFEKGKSDKPRKITMSDFIEVVKNVKPSISMDSLKKMVEWARKYASTF
ncbi:MAG: ATP-binding protein [Thaumarchaeota archaeon]|jgi:SpoVK/Ycf46/Vps4 family AAA+-type ATPase|nr:ATP-binding protein [Candidatus Geocrenenecus arthurdayi]MCL7391416.1 ATP-binding protein [Candidatus Geocrenenecus arthurdayi]MCL7396812.1 ATP-binding protein [Candidatus Geocrenenecus arthurdayi]MCL7403378.1 ATP-binding protein [Candidatus Geocrenenecus arthurdayi]